MFKLRELFMPDSLKQFKYLESLKIQYESLELQIEKIMRSKVINQLELQNLKKRKLVVRELIFEQQLKLLIPNNDNRNFHDDKLIS
jgi:hypothetical protein